MSHAFFNHRRSNFFFCLAAPKCHFAVAPMLGMDKISVSVWEVFQLNELELTGLE